MAIEMWVMCQPRKNSVVRIFVQIRGYKYLRRVKTERDQHWVERGVSFWIFGSNPRAKTDGVARTSLRRVGRALDWVKKKQKKIPFFHQPSPPFQGGQECEHNRVIFIERNGNFRRPRGDGSKWTTSKKRQIVAPVTQCASWGRSKQRQTVMGCLLHNMTILTLCQSYTISFLPFNGMQQKMKIRHRTMARAWQQQRRASKSSRLVAVVHWAIAPLKRHAEVYQYFMYM